MRMCEENRVEASGYLYCCMCNVCVGIYAL